MTSKLWILCVLLLLAVSVRAQQSTISYQGAIANAAGMPADSGTYSITVSFYTDESGIQPLWQDTFGTFVKNGIFNIALGSGRPLPPPSDLDRPIWVGIRIGSMAESRPLNRLTAVPMAMNVADSAITSAKMATDYVSSISVNGQKVTGQGSELNIVGGNGVNLAYDDESNSLVLNAGASNNGTNGKGAKAETTPPMTDPWYLEGNDNTSPYPEHNFLGTTDTSTLWIRVYAYTNSPLYGTAMRYAQAYSQSIPDIMGGFSGNFVFESGDTMVERGGNVIAGGGDAGDENWIYYSHFGTISGGLGNRISDPSDNTLGYKDDYKFQVVGGGEKNHVLGDYSAVLCGKFNKALGEGSFIGSGYMNYVNMYSSWSAIGGGDSNTILDTASFIGGGLWNETSHGNFSVIGGGSYNSVSDSIGTIGGGEHNSVSDIHSSILGGLGNSTSGEGYSAIGGGRNNTITGGNSAIAGGANLKLGDNSFGFNVDPSMSTSHITDLSSTGAGFDSIAYFGNVDLLLGNTDDKARELRFYGPNTSRTRLDTSKYSSFQAGGQLANINYTLPISAPDSLGWVLGIGGASGANIQLQWQRTDTGSGGGGTPAWYLSGNTGTAPPINYLGTQDSEAFEIHVHNNTLDTSGGNQRVMQYSEGWTSPNILGGSSFNTIAPALSGAAILSGGSEGEPNSVSDTLSVVGGGEWNTIDMGASHSIVGGGEGNYINAEHAVIGGGGFNAAYGRYSFVGGGGGYVPSGGGSDAMSMSTPSSVTPILLPYNLASAQYTVIGGGGGNSAVNTLSSVLGGEYNYSAGYASSIGGGAYNTARDSFSTIAGGNQNYVQANGGSIGGGQSNSVYDSYATVAGGYSNRINTGSPYSSILGGEDNRIVAARSTIGGGIGNEISSIPSSLDTNIIIDTVTTGSVIAGGDTNVILAPVSTIGGGSNNFINFQQVSSCDCSSPASVGTIAGGVQDTIGPLDGRWMDSSIRSSALYASPIMTAIGGGYKNTVNGHYGVVSGGYANHATGEGSAIPGGIGLQAYEFQTVVGKYNANLARGSFHLSPLVDTVPALGDLFTFVLGNGTSADSAHRSDAIEASDNGHLIIHDSLGNAPPSFIRADPIIGGAYKDNMINAWGDVDGHPGLAPEPPYPARNDFGDTAGTTAITHSATGSYTVTIQCFNPDGSRRILTAASIQVTVEENHGEGCGYATANRISGNTFAVHTYNGSNPTHPGSCNAADRDFFFTVVGR